jgi:hypothetical protein
MPEGFKKYKMPLFYLVKLLSLANMRTVEFFYLLKYKLCVQNELS